MRAFRGVLVVLLLLCLFAGLSAQDVAGGSGITADFGLAGFDMWKLELYGGLKGLQLIPGAESRVLLYAGGGYVGDAYYRDSADMVLAAGDESAAFKKAFGSGKLGLELGLLYDPALAKNNLFGRFFFKSLYESYVFDAEAPAAIEASTLPDRAGAWESSLFAGLFWDALDFNPLLQTNSGTAAEVSVDWAPGAAFNSVFGAADYVRLNASGRLYLPILESDQFGLYLTERFIADALLGTAEGIPGLARRRVGGFSLSGAPGGAVRGIDSGRYDTWLKLVNNLDLRFNFLPLFSTAAAPRDKILVPELFGFFDAALVDNLNYVLADWHASVGGGLIFNIRFAGIKFDLGYYVTYSIMEARPNFFNLVLGAHHY
ncbi:MAG: hypothetical protein KKI09_00865 [Spirochaetes bacterium]|nr:hypothetical protein [Spirochaetota bacterium]MBU0953951.1 hypothetical protein [Spirochaetota bacterium]